MRFLTLLLLTLFSLSIAHMKLNSSYLHSLEKAEELRVKELYIEQGVTYIEDQMIIMAKNGYSEYSIQDCDHNIHDPIPLQSSVTPKNYNYLKAEIIESISKVLGELCEDCTQRRREVNHCIVYTISW